MIRCITYTDDRMTKSADLCVLSSLKWGCDESKIYRPHAMPDWIQNNPTFSKERGAGYWIWKPAIIMSELSNMNEGDTLVYCDAGIEWIGNPREIIKVMDQDLFLFSNGWKHSEWCKGDVFKHFGLKPGEEKQVQASVIFCKVGALKMIEEWLSACLLPWLVDDSPSEEPNVPTFAEHRHDQAILTSVAIKHGIRQHWWPTIYSEHIRIAGDNYPALFNHHRKRNNEW